MARKRRKDKDKPYAFQVLVPPDHRIAAHIRLSVEAVRRKGDSVDTHQKIIQNYLEYNLELNLYETYVDSGCSGTTFERPGFRRMI